MKIKTKKPLILIDGSSYLFRAYHALPPLTNSKGQPTGAIYGVINMIRKLMKEYEPDHVAVVFDPKGKTFRHKLYAEYKANRVAMPDELRVQIKLLFEIIEALGFPLIIKEGVEADDVIATLAHTAEQQGLQTVVSTVDKDLAQIVNHNISLINTMNDRVLDIAGVIEKFGVEPEKIIDYLTLVGDSSDNVPGVPKVGPKTAVKWLSEYKSLENILQNANEIKGKVGENLRSHLDNISLSKELVTIKKDVDIQFDLDQFSMREKDNQKLIQLFTDLEFRNWLAEIKSDEEKSPVQGKRNYETILDEQNFNCWLDKLAKIKCFALDTETTSLDAMLADLVGISIAVKKGEAAYIPFMHDYPGAPHQLAKEIVLDKLKPLLEDKKRVIIGQNLKYDIEVLKNCGVDIHATLCDTMLESYVLNSNLSRHNLDTLALNYLGLQTITFEDIAGKGAKQLTFNQIDLAQASTYAAEDADVALQLHEVLMAKIDKEPAIKKVLFEIEWPLMPVLAQMEYVGVLIDADKLKKQSQVLKKRIEKLEEEAFAIAGYNFNISSTKQLQTVLYEKLNLPILKRTPKGAPSTAEEVLQDLALDYPLPKIILEYRSLSKLKSTYTDTLPEQVNPKTKRVHTSYNQAITTTGRLSSNNPNLQNIPVRTEEGRKIRQAFIAPHGCKILAADYSQIELRIMAHLSGDPALEKAFAAGLDVHQATAAEVFGVAIENVTSLQRRSAKAINFGLMYGMSAFGLSRQLGIPQKAAQQHIDRYFSRYVKVHEYMEQARNKAAEQGFVETIFGRRVYVPDINASNIPRKRAAERAAINAPLQGTAADIIKIAMIKIAEWIRQMKPPVKMIMQVHDELVFEVEDTFIKEASREIRRFMERTVKLEVPLVVEVGVGDNWDEAH